MLTLHFAQTVPSPGPLSAAAVTGAPQVGLLAPGPLEGFAGGVGAMGHVGSGDGAPGFPQYADGV